MGIQVSAKEAAWLAHRNERVVRGWIKSGKLHATPTGPRLPAPGAEERVGPSRWAIDTDDLATVAGVRLDAERLSELQASAPNAQASLRRRVDALEREVAQLRAQMARFTTATGAATGLESAHTSSQEGAGWPEMGEQRSRGDAPLTGRSGPVARAGDGSGDAFTATYGEWTPRPRPLTVALADRGIGGPLPFKTKADAARWLGRHGVNPLTPKSWPGWPPIEMTPMATLTFALDIWREARARRDWRVTWSLRRCDDTACVCQGMLAD
jgi:hypothetical protein